MDLWVVLLFFEILLKSFSSTSMFLRLSVILNHIYSMYYSVHILNVNQNYINNQTFFCFLKLQNKYIGIKI